MRFFEIFGQKILGWAESCGEVVLLVRRTFYWMFKTGVHKKNFFAQMLEMGAKSLPVTSLTLFFTGMVLALQTGFSFLKVFNEPLYVGRLVGFTIVKELGPVLTAIVFSGRVGAAVAAELGTMQVTEQIDALYTLGTNPIRYLVVPRVLAALFMVPILTFYSDFLGILGGYLVSHLRFSISSVTYFDEVYALRFVEFLHGTIKSIIFALTVIIISCYRGLKTWGGAEGVGKSTTAAVVISMVLILVGDYFLTAVLVAVGIG